MIKRIFPILICGLGIFSAKGQERKNYLITGIGIYTAPKYARLVYPGFSVSAGYGCALKKQVLLSVDVEYGTFGFYFQTDPRIDGKQRSENIAGYGMILGVVPLSNTLKLNIGGGIGILHYTDEILFASKGPNDVVTGTYKRNFTGTNIGVPLRVELQNRMTKRFLLGGRFSYFKNRRPIKKIGLAVTGIYNF